MNAPMTELTQQLEQWLRATSLNTLELSGPGTFVRLEQVTGAPPGLEVTARVNTCPEISSTTVRAGSVGVVMHAHPLREDPLVQPGQQVYAGQTVAILKVGAVLLLVPAPHDGTVLQVHADDGCVVGYGERLVEIGKKEPHAN